IASRLTIPFNAAVSHVMNAYRSGICMFEESLAERGFPQTYWFGLNTIGQVQPVRSRSNFS
ncbi:MAG: hypothetical protein AAFQ57_00655, partial [Cyanobacteria bacterium J06626_14]